MGDNQNLCAMESRLDLKRYLPSTGLGLLDQHARVQPFELSYCQSSLFKNRVWSFYPSTKYSGRG